MPDCESSSGYPHSSDPKKTPLPKQFAKGSSQVLSGTYKSPTSLISGPIANRIIKTKQERAQGSSAKFSKLNAEGKAALKGKGKVDVNKPRQPSNKELAAIFRATGHVLDYTSKLPVTKPISRKGSPTSVSPRSSSASSCSYHGPLSSGPVFPLPKVYTSFTDLAEAAKHNVASPPKSPLKQPEDGQKKLFRFGTASLSEAAKVPAPQKSQASASGTKPEVKTTVRQSDTNSRTKPVRANVGNSGVQTAKHSGVTPAVNTNFRHSNWGEIKRRNAVPVPNKNDINLQAVKSVADVRKHKIFPSELSLRMQERLCDLLDNLNHNANDVAVSYVKSRIVGDSLKAMHHLFLIGNKGKIHFFNPVGHYVGQVVVNEPVWFYGRVAGSNKNMYLSLGDSKTSKCFLKSRFPTLAEFVSNDWAKGKSSLKHVTVFDPVKNRNFRGDRGFCWLPLYTSSDIPVSQYPTGGLVRLFTLYDKFGPVPIVKSGKYYHYDPKGRKHIKFPNVWVGAEPQTESSEINLSVSSLVKAMGKKGSLIAMCCFMFPPELINRDGVVVHPATDVVVTRNGCVLTYNIANTSDSCTHNLDDVLSFITTSSPRSESGLVYSKELLNQNGPYMDFQVALSTNSNVRAGTRCFDAWLKNKSEVTVQRLMDDNQIINLKLVMDRDFVRRVLSYSANVCNSLDDRTYEYVLSNIRSQTTMMIVGSKIVHNKVDISNDVIVELPGTFLKEAAKRRRRTIEQTKRANAGFFNKLLGSVLSLPRKLISGLISFIRKLLPKELKAKFDGLLDEPALIVDCADVIQTETSNQAGSRQLKNEVLADVLSAVKELTLLSAPQTEIEEEEETVVEEDEIPNPTSRKQVRGEIQGEPKKKGALKGGGGNWYDFILPKKASKKTGSSILAEIWRIIRKLDLACRNSRVMCAIIELLKVIFRALKTVATPLLFNPGNFFTSGKKKESPLEQGANVVKNLFGGFLESLVKFIDLSFFGRLFNVFADTKTCAVENITDWKNSMSDNIISGLQTRIACGLKYMGLKPPKGWLNESSTAKLILNRVLSELKGLPLFPLATAALLTLLASKTVREKLLGFSNRAICFIESIKVKRPIFICSIILGAVMKNLARLSFLMMPVEECREVCIGMMFSNILNCAYNTYREPTVLNKVEVLSNFLLLQRNMEIMSSVFDLQKRVVDEPTVEDVADVSPKLSSFEINSDVEEVIDDFRLNIKDLKNAKLEKRPMKFEVGESSGSKKAETVKPKVAMADKRGKESSKRSAGDCGVVINDDRISETKADAAPKEKEKKPESVVKVSKAYITEEPVAQTEPTRIPTPSYIKLDEERNAVSSQEDLEVTVDEVLSEEKEKKTGDTRADAYISQLSEAEIDLLVESFNSEIFGAEDKEKEKMTVKSESISGTDSESSESDHETVFVDEPMCETITTSDSSERFIGEVPCEESHLTCSCGIDINVRPFTAPAPLPLIGGDHELALVVKDGDGSFGAECVKKAVKPSSEGKPTSLRPQTSLLMSSTVKSKSCSMLSLCSDSTGVEISDFEDFLKIESYKNMKHYVTNSGNVGAVIDAYLYNLHVLHKEVSVLHKALNQPENMEFTLCLSKVREKLPVACDKIFYLRSAGVCATVMPPERLSFFYDKLSAGINNDRNKYQELFQFLDILRNVVATNNGNFVKFLDVDSVMEYFRRRYPDGGSLSNINKAPSSDYCCLTVPALTTFLNSVRGCFEGLTTVLAVGFTRKSDTDELWSFKNTFVVFENSGEISAFYGDNMDTSNSALLEV